MTPPATDPLLARLVRWCDQPSGTSDLAGLAAMADLLLTEFTPLGGAWQRVPVAGGRHVVKGSIRPEAPTRIVLTGHYDTVYDTAHPFKRCDVPPGFPDRLRGPGVADMKGGLVILHQTGRFNDDDDLFRDFYRRSMTNLVTGMAPRAS